MSTISSRLPSSLHESARTLAQREHVSINQIVTPALTEKVSALMTEEYLQTRVAQADRTKFERAMAKIADVEQLPRDTPQEA